MDNFMLLLCALFADDSWLFLNSLFKSRMRAHVVQHRRGCGLGWGGRREWTGCVWARKCTSAHRDDMPNERTCFCLCPLTEYSSHTLPVFLAGRAASPIGMFMAPSRNLNLMSRFHSLPSSFLFLFHSGFLLLSLPDPAAVSGGNISMVSFILYFIGAS